MAIFFMDSMAHYTTEAQAETKVANTGAAPVAATGAFGAPSVSPAGGTFTAGYKVNFAAISTVVLSGYFNASQIQTSQSGRWIEWRDVAQDDGSNGGLQDTLYLYNNGQIQLYRFNKAGGTKIAESAADVVQFNVQHHILVELVLHNTTGSILIKIDGDTVLSATGLDTNHLTTAVASDIRLWGDGSTNEAAVQWSHVALADTSGEITGQPIVEALFPDGAGNYSQWNRSAGATNYSNVDETTPDDDTTYNYESTAGDRDSYTYSNMLHNAASILAVALVPRVKKDDATARTVKRFVRISGTDYDGTAVGVPAGYAYLQEVLQTNPATAAAWTPTEVNALEAGIKVES